MKSLRTVLAVSLLAFSVATPVLAQSLALPEYMTADHNMRAGKIIGMPVFNEQGEKIGTIDDVLLPSSGGEVTTVLNVSGFVGGHKMVKVPLSHVRFGTDKPMMPGGEKTAVMAMPSYDYVQMGGG